MADGRALTLVNLSGLDVRSEEQRLAWASSCACGGHRAAIVSPALGELGGQRAAGDQRDGDQQQHQRDSCHL